jgi:hypothetical protein
VGIVCHIHPEDVPKLLADFVIFYWMLKALALPEN